MSETKVETKNNGDKKKRGKKVLPILLIIVLAVAGYSVYNFTQSANYFMTENAKVTAKMYYITGVTSGELLEWNASLGQVVKKGDILGRQSVLPYITAPVDGTIVVNNGVQGQLAAPTTQLAVVADTDHQYIGVNVEETDIQNIKIGQRADVTIDAYPGVNFSGVVSDIDLTTQTFFSGSVSFSTSGTYTKVTQLIPVKIYIENPDQLDLTFGMNANVKVYIHEDVTEEAAALAAAKNAPISQTRIYTTTVEANDQMNIISNVAGKVENVYKSVGDTVVAGDVLFELNKTDRELLVNQATANYNIAKANYNSTLANFDSKSSVTPAQVAYTTALDNYNNTKALYDAGSASKAALDNAEAQMTSAKAQLDTSSRSLATSLETARAQLGGAEASLAIAEKNLQDCTVTAPISGEIATSNVSVGDMISSQVFAMTIVDSATLKAEISVTETQISTVSLGAEARVVVSATGDTVKALVTRIAPASNPQTGTFPVEVQIDNANGSIKPGMVVEISFNN